MTVEKVCTSLGIAVALVLANRGGALPPLHVADVLWLAGLAALAGWLVHPRQRRREQGALDGAAYRLGRALQRVRRA